MYSCSSLFGSPLLTASEDDKRCSFPLRSRIWKDRGTGIRNSLYPTFRGPNRARRSHSLLLEAPGSLAVSLGTFSQTNKQQKPELKLTKPESNPPTKEWRERVHWRTGPSRPQKLYVVVEWGGEGEGMRVVCEHACLCRRPLCCCVCSQ